MKRREFVEKLGVGSAVAFVTGGAIVSGAGSPKAKTPKVSEGHAHGGHDPVKGPLASATVHFGAWKTDVPLDRYPNVSPIPANAHQMIPHQVTIKEGGSVAFVIAGLHQIIVYAPGVRPEAVNAALTRPTTGTPAGVPLINDPSGRIYAGLDPSAQPSRVERTEVVQFTKRGKYLVICGVQPHFVDDDMFGWVRVIEGHDDD